MKSIIIALFLFFLAVNISFGSEMTDGTVYVNKPVECHLILQNGSISTNMAPSGKTILIGDALVELNVINNNTLFYFSGGPLINVLTNSTFTINIFDQEVKNIDASPRKAEFGSCNLGVTVGIGEYAVFCPKLDELSLFTITTPFTSYELRGGKYYIRVTDRFSVVYVIEGSMNVHGNKKVDKTDKGNLLIVRPTDPDIGISDKVSTSINKIEKQDEINRFSLPIILTESLIENIEFYVVEGKTIGILIK